MSYDTKMSHFVQALKTATNDKWEVESGRKFDKVFTNNGQRLGRYMVERKTGNVYAIKSWAQVNTRRWFGTLDTINQFDWKPYHATPLPGSEAVSLIKDREAGFASGYKKRGRPRKNPVAVP